MSVNIIYMYYSDRRRTYNSPPHIIGVLECFQRALFPFYTFLLHFFFFYSQRIANLTRRY